MGRVSINEVLSDLAMGVNGSITYIRSQGKRAGTKKTVARCMEGWNYTAFIKKRPLANVHALNRPTLGKQKLKGIIPIVDLTNDQQLTLLISHIVGWNGLEVRH